MRDHGGNLDAAMAEFGGTRADWLDLSTGINPRSYPVPQLAADAWDMLPTKTDQAHLKHAAQTAFDTDWPCLPTAGAQAGIQMVPRILPTGQARVIGPTYNEHAASLRASGWDVDIVADMAALHGADLAVVVNPNNPDGAIYDRQTLLDLANKVGILIVDESFGDPHPELSLLPCPLPDNVIVLRSFGKFYGLAGLRLGFTFGPQAIIDKLQDLSGPWPVSGPAIAIGQSAYADTDWQQTTIQRLSQDAARMDELAQSHGWQVLGGTTLFRLYDTPDAEAAQRELAQHHIWSRIFPYSDTWIRLGLPDGADRWAQLERALAGQG